MRAGQTCPGAASMGRAVPSGNTYSCYRTGIGYHLSRANRVRKRRIDNPSLMSKVPLKPWIIGALPCIVAPATLLSLTDRC